MSSCLPAWLRACLALCLVRFYSIFMLIFFLFDFILVFISLKHLESHKNSSHSEIGRERENERVLLTRFIRFYDSFLFFFLQIFVHDFDSIWLDGWLAGVRNGFICLF